MHSEQTVVIIGSGIIGVSIGLELQRHDFRVTIIDRSDILQGASEGNAGAFALSDIVPLATPGIMKAAPRWLLDPLGPLSIRPSYFFSIAPWLIRFWRASWNDKFPTLMLAQSELMELSRSALERQTLHCNAESLLRREGQLRLYDHRSSFKEASSYWHACEEFGISHDLLRSSNEIEEIQPGICSTYKYAGFTPDWINVVDPKLWLGHLRHRFMEGGGHILEKEAYSLEIQLNTINVKCMGTDLKTNFAVVAAGAWSKPLALSVGDKFPLETERGYNTTFNPVDFELRTHLTFADHGFVVSKIGSKMRVGGAVELGGLHTPPNYERSQILLSKAKRFLPGLVAQNCSEWMGFRSSMPDSLPVIGTSPKTPRILYAFGHGHLGLTQSAATAELVRNTIMGNNWPISPSPFSPERFLR